MKRNYALSFVTIFLLLFISVAYAAFNSELNITGEGSVLKDTTAPTCGSWYLRDSSLTTQEAYNQNKFINPGTNTTWTNTDKTLFIECTDNMEGDYGCINVDTVTASGNTKRYFKDVKDYTTSIKSDGETVTVTLYDAYLNSRTCTLPSGGSNPYIDKESPTVTIIPTAANKFTYLGTDNNSSELKYMVTDTNTVPSIDDVNWSDTPTEFTIDNTEAKTYYVWTRDGANIVSETINTYLLTADVGTGSTLTLRYQNSGGAILSTGYVLDGTPVHVNGSIRAEYNSLVLTSTTTTTEVISNNSVQMINGNTTISSVAVLDQFTLTADANGGSIPITAGWTGSGDTSIKLVTYDAQYGTLPNAPTKAGYEFAGWSLLPDGYTEVEYVQSSGTQYINSGYVPNTDTAVDVKFLFNSMSSQWQNVLGSRTTAATDDQFSFSSSNNNASAGFGAQEISLGKVFAANITYEVSMDKTNIKINGVVKGTFASKQISSALPIYIFGRNTAGGFSNAFIGKIYRVVIYEDGVVVRNYIPCINDATGKAGLYDLVNGVFYGNVGTGDFTYGTANYLTPQTIVKAQDNHSIYAKYTANTYTVEFDSNGSSGTSMADQTITYGVETVLSKNTYTMTNFTFTGWNTEADGSGTSYADEQSVLNLTTVNNDVITLYAQWVQPGLYDSSGNVIKTWSELESLGLTKSTIESNYTSSTYDVTAGSPYKVFTDNNLSGKLILPETITKIGNYAFHDCPGLESIVIPTSTISIGEHAFDNADDIETITIPSSVTSIGQYAFASCDSLTSVNLPGRITSILTGVFSDCSNLSTISIPSSVTTIGNYAFANSGLESISIPSSVTSIGNSAFNNTELTSITIPRSVTSIGTDAFANSTSLSSITVDSNNAVYDSRNNSNAIIETATDKLIVGNASTVIPNSVTSIGARAFKGSSITSITIPNSVNDIGADAFLDCANLSIVIFDNTIGWYVSELPNASSGTNMAVTNPFTNATNLKSTYHTYYWKSSIYKVEFNANGGRGTMADQYIGTVTPTRLDANEFRRDGHTFAGWNTSPNGDGTDYADQEQVTGLAGMGETIILYAKWNLSATPGLYDTNNTLILTWSELNALGLTNSTVEYDYTSANYDMLSGSPYNVFTDNSLVGGLVLPTTIGSIGDYAFNNIPGLLGIVIPDGVTSIGDHAFAGTGMTAIEIPNSVTSIGEGVFASTEIDTITVGLGNMTYDSRNNSNAIIETSTNKLISGISSTVIPNTVTSIGSGAFIDPVDLTTITIPSSVVMIEPNAFVDCSDLTAVTFENPNGWFYTSTPSGVSGTDLTLTNTATNVTYLTTTYNSYYWKNASYKVVFDPNGGSGTMADQFIGVGASVSLNQNTYTKSEYTFSGWYLGSVGSSTVYADEETVTGLAGNNETVILYAKWIDNNAVCELNGTEYYTSIQEAVDMAPSTPSTIKLIKDVNLVSTMIDLYTKNTDKNITFDLNGHTISGSTYIIRTNGTSVVEVKNGDIRCSAGSGAIDINGTGRFKMFSGTIITTGNRQSVYNNGGTVELGGDVYMESKQATQNNRGTVQNNAGTTIITGGTYVSTTGHAVSVTSGTLILGEEDGVYDTDSIVLEGTLNGIYTTVNISVFDGMIKGKSAAVNNESKITNIETGATKVKDEVSPFYRLYYTLP